MQLYCIIGTLKRIKYVILYIHKFIKPIENLFKCDILEYLPRINLYQDIS